MKKTGLVTALGVFLILVQAVVSAIALYRIRVFDVLTNKMVGILIALMMLALIVSIALQFFKGINIIGCVFAFIVSVGMIWTAGAVHKTQEAIGRMGERTTKSVAMQVMLLNDSPINSFRELAGKTVGILSLDEEYNNDVTLRLHEDIGADYIAAEYDDDFSLSKALIDGKVDCIILYAARVDMVDDLYMANPDILGKTAEGNPKVFSDITKVIKSYDLQVETVKPQDDPKQNEGREEIDTAVTPFIVYISGIDCAGDISSYGRSDVNLILCVNPITKQVCMISTPRDSYVFVPNHPNGDPWYDKLTHAGVYAEHAALSIATLEKLYGIDIDYYVRVNFTSVVNIVDALGGVSVYSKYEFDSKNILGEHYNEGYNEVNGKRAIIFCRERYSFPDGDYQRGRNHIEMLKAILNKVMSPAILTNYSALLDEVSNNIETNMTESEITALVKMQLDNNATWNFVHYNAEGIDNGLQQLRYTASSKTAKSYVTILDPASVNFVCDLMERILNGEVVTQEMVDKKFNMTGDAQGATQ